MRGRRAVTALLAVSALLAADAGAQPPPSDDPPRALPPPFTTTLATDLLRDLPLGGNIYSLLETVVPETIAERFNSGGLNAGAPSGVAGFLHSASQTLFGAGEFDIASPLTGEPLLFPELAPWASVTAAAGLMPIAHPAPGLAVTLDPPLAGGRWAGVFEAFASGGGLIAAPRPGPPATLRLQEWRSGRVALSAPIAPRVSLAAGASWSQNAVVPRAAAHGISDRLASAYAHATVRPDSGGSVRTFVWLQRARTRVRDRSLHVQTTYERTADPANGWKLSGGYTERRRTRGEPPAFRVADRLADGPIPGLAAYAREVERRWSARGSISRAAWSRHALTASLGLDGGSAALSGAFSGTIGETVDGLNARLWEFGAAPADSRRSVTIAALSVQDRVALSESAAVEAGARVEYAGARARGAERGVGWLSLLPRVQLTRRLGTPLGLELVTGYRRTAWQPRLDVLAIGDPGAPAASVFRWDEAGARGPLVAQAGPGTRDDGAASAVDPGVRRPLAHEFAIGMYARPRGTWRIGVFGVARRQTPLLAIVNTGLSAGDYGIVRIPDANADLLGRGDDHVLTVYDRLPESFGLDRYLLTNADVAAATAGALVVTGDVRTERLYLSIGATASASVGPAAHRGFRADENDHEIGGELLANPNAAEFARGRLFNDRAYVIKWTTVYRFPGGVRLGAIARYQDGQPFSRLVVVPGLAQGAEAVRGFANGRSRFAFTGTLDLRVQKRFMVRGTAMDAIADVYNALDMGKEVEEYVITGPRFREITAVQPPRAIMIGVRLTRQK